MPAPVIYFASFNHVSEGLTDVWFYADYWVDISV